MMLIAIQRFWGRIEWALDRLLSGPRDVSRSKRDIKTFAIKVSLPNQDHRLFTGMTATVLLPGPKENKGWLARL